MTYLIDGRSLQDRSAVRGIGTYLRGLLSGYAELGVAQHIELLLRRGPEPAETRGLGLHRSRGRIPDVDRRLQPMADPLLVAAVLRRLHPHLYHGVEYAQPVTTSTPTVITVHDLIPFVFPEKYRWARRERLLALKLLARADALIADSRATARDLVRIAHADGERIHVVPLGVSESFRPATPAAIERVRTAHGLTRPFVLAVGTFDPRKRIDLLARAFATLRRHHDVDLVVAGSQGEFEDLVRTTLTDVAPAENLHLIGYVDLPTLVTLYSDAQALLFTSEYEGFGLPPLEAMACGAPVVMFDNSSLPEVGGDVALSVPDGDGTALGEAAASLLASPGDIAARRKRGIEWASTFTWRRTALNTLGVYERVLRDRGSRS